VRPAGARIRPGTTREIGVLNGAIARAVGLATGGRPPNLFTTIARHRRLFRPWLRFAARLMPGGVLPRADSELVILRVAHNCGSEYEWRHHERLAATAGLDRAEIEAARAAPAPEALTPRRQLLLRVADELHADRDLSNATWDELRAQLSEVETIELCMLVGHYEMLAMTLNALRVEPDEPGRAPRAVVAVQRALARRSRAGG
jgi:alkylhydroperoxidase family enzyme